MLTNTSTNHLINHMLIPSHKTPCTPPEAFGSGYGVPAAAVLPHEPQASCSET